MAKQAAEAGDLILAQLFMANAESLLKDATVRAEAAYVAAQDMGTFMPKVVQPPEKTAQPPGELPRTGDPLVARLPLLALVVGLLMVVSGVYLYRRTRHAHGTSRKG